MRYNYFALSGAHPFFVPTWKLVRVVKAANGTSVCEYQAKSPVPGRMYQMRVCEDASGSYGSYSITR